MKLDSPALLRRLGSSIAEGNPTVKRKSAGAFSTQRTCARCPLHQDADASLVVHPGGYFSCMDPSCMFSGDAVALAALARKVPVRDAVAMFMPGGDLAQCLETPMDREEADLYLAESEAQAGLKAYLAKCRRALRESPEKARVRTGMSRNSARTLHPDAGMFLDLGDGTPPCLAEFRRPRYRGLTLVLYPFSFNGDVSRIEVVDPSNPVFRRTVVVSHPSSGVFGEECVSGLKSIVAVENPAVAASLYAAHALVSQKPCPVVAFSDYPLPSSMSGVQSIRILSTADFPVSTGFLARTMSAPEAVSGARPGPRIRVMATEKRHDALTMSDLSAVATGTGVFHDVPWLFAKRLADMVRRGCQQQAMEAVSSEDMPEAAKAVVVETAREIAASRRDNGGHPEAYEAVAEMLSSRGQAAALTMRLANGRTVVREPSSLVELSPRGVRSLLCNVGVSVDGRIVSASGTDIYSCTFTASDGSPPVRMRLPARDASDPARIRRALSSEYAKRGLNPYIAFYRVPGCDWSDVMAKLSEHCPVTREVSSLGMDGLSRVNLPEAVVCPDGRVERQESIFTLPEKVLRTYSAIPADDSSGTDPWRRLLDGCGNLYTLSFALGAMHVVYQACHRLYRPDARERSARHLFYAETEPNIWTAVFCRLHELFSGGGMPPVVDYSQPSSTFREYAGLGGMPLIASVPASTGRFAPDLDASGVSLVGLLDSTTAVLSNGKVPAVYLTPSDDRPAEVDLPSGQGMDALRRSFVPLLAKFMREARIDAAFRASAAPCVAAYLEACRILGAEAFPTDEIAKTWFPGVGMNGVGMFSDILHRSLQDGGRPHVVVVNGPPQPGCSFTRRGQHVFVMKDVVVVSHMVADMMTQASRGMCRFDRQQLGDEMRATGMLARLPKELGIDGSRCWCLTREAWETRFVRPPLPFRGDVGNDTIPLAPVDRAGIPEPATPHQQ